MAPARPRPQLEVSLGSPHRCLRRAQCRQRSRVRHRASPRLQVPRTRMGCP
ncbi:hypothetical protein I306_06574 [Cryptococcus gattii EJB2]|uniref:Uncharacterized protein n=1 Tax=Cryptococcus gattii EJB2 TaxID=1296103 RepID=A0ABR5BLJ9_9TREE|nr:hypothetical protein I306_06574 [Cryptococcus gattii EJB2]